MMAREKNLGYLTPLPNGGFRVVRVFEKAVRKGFRLDGCLIPEHAGYKTNCRVNQHLRCKLSSGQDIVADRDFLHAKLIYDTLVYALETAAEEDRARPARKIAGDRLVKGFSTR